MIIHVPRRFTSNAWGGTEQVLNKTLPALQDLGFASEVYTSKALDASAHENAADVTCTRFDYRYPEWPLSDERKQRYDSKGGNLVSFPLMKALKKRSDIELIHCHTGNRLAAQCIHVARKRRIPVVMTLHGGHFDIPQDEAADLRGDDLKAPLLPYGKVLSWWFKAREVLQRVDGIICVGRDEYDLVRTHLPQQKAFFIPGGVDIAKAQSGDAHRGHAFLQRDAVTNRDAVTERDAGVPLIVCVARLDKQKDQQTLIKAWKQLPYACDLALLGPETSPGYQTACEQLAAGGPGRCIMPGGVDQQTVADCLAAAQLAVLPSRHEPFGLSCLESWAAGTPLITSDVGGPRWLLRDGAGLTFPVGDAKALQQAIMSVLHFKDQAQTLVTRGLQQVEAFSWENRARALVAAYAACGGPGESSDARKPQSKAI